jgi:hypothetical protein
MKLCFEYGRVQVTVAGRFTPLMRFWLLVHLLLPSEGSLSEHGT